MHVKWYFEMVSTVKRNEFVLKRKNTPFRLESITKHEQSLSFRIEAYQYFGFAEHCVDMEQRISRLAQLFKALLALRVR